MPTHRLYVLNLLRSVSHTAEFCVLSYDFAYTDSPSYAGAGFRQIARRCALDWLLQV